MTIKSDKKFNVVLPNQKEYSYPVVIEESILDKSGKILKKSINSSKILLVTNDTVFPIYGNQVCKSIKDAGFKVKTVVIPDGEDYKNINWFKVILDKAIDFQLERQDTIVALGGGVIGDMAGYAAASYLRGINIVHIPTTLLAQVDSSIGGKVGINHIKGKNLIGAFYQPKCVIIDPTTLETLDKKNFKNGLGEVLKYAFIENNCQLNENAPEFFDFLNNNIKKIYAQDPETLSSVISYCCQLKANVVKLDEKEAGLRMILNLGHTVGHALETSGNYSLLTHGESVSIGMIAAFNIARLSDLIEESLLKQAQDLIEKYGLKTTIPKEISINRLMDNMKLDKKVSNKNVRFILPVKTLGNVQVCDKIDNKHITKALEAMY